MPDVYHVRITRRALADLQSIFDFIQKDSPQNAGNMIRALLDAIDGLTILPHRYRVPRIGRTSSRNVRSMPVWPYLVRYRIEENTKVVRILQIRHGARRQP